MPLSATEAERAERLLKRTIAKRDSLASQVQLLYELAHKLEAEKDILPLFRARKKDIESFRTQFLAEQDSIFDLLIQLQRADEYDKVHVFIGNTFSENYYFIMAMSEAFLDDNSPSTATTVLSGGDNSHVRLPKIDLPKFDGNLIKWSSFRDTFASLIHDNQNVGKLERFHYLLACLSGSSLTVVKSIPLSAANYDIAWNALIERYDNQRLLATAHLEKLFSFRPITSESLPALLAFVNIFQENIAAIKALGVKDLAGFILFFIGSRALDPVTRRMFESSVSQDSIPTFDILLQFVQQRCKVLENIGGPGKYETRSSKAQPLGASRASLTIATANNSSTGTRLDKKYEGTTPKKCLYCKQDHLVYRCQVFHKVSVAKRREFVQLNNLCFSCLSPSHMVAACQSKFRCKTCGERHHTLLHSQLEADRSGSIQSSNHVTTTALLEDNGQPKQFAGMSYANNTVVLATAIVRIPDCTGTFHSVRVLLDSGSQISAITADCANRIGLRRQKCHTEVSGLGQETFKQVKSKTECSFIPNHTDEPVFTCSELLVLQQITSFMPSKPLPSVVRTHYDHLPLADPLFDKPARVDVLIGCDVFPYLIRPCSKVIHTMGFPSALDTYLGWTIVGTVINNVSMEHFTSSTSLSTTSTTSLDKMLQRFWSIEEPTPPRTPTTEDELCENWFAQTVSRDASGRFCVALPFRDVVSTQSCPPVVDDTSDSSLPHGLGDSRAMALKRLFNLEQRLIKEPALYDAYRSFMDVYLALGHMKVASRPGKYFIPHHAVMKGDGDVSKLRVVFDASAKSSSGRSLNDVLCTGPKLQTDISELLLSCRLYKFIFIADIVKMYRQISVREEDCAYQHILWRPSPDQEVQEFELLTITYGLSCAPFLAIRVLHALDAVAEPRFSAAKGILTHNTYVDDILVGGNTEEELCLKRKHIVGLLLSAGCTLKKWSSNSISVLEKVSAEERAELSSFDPKDEQVLKVLGLHWNPGTDTFGYHTRDDGSKCTKRGILSAIAKLFDPIGTLGPTLLYAKIIMQKLWQDRLDWDTPIPAEIQSAWNEYVVAMPSLRRLQITRYIDVCQSKDIQLIGFCDASQKGYAGTVFLRVIDSSSEIKTYLLTCKTRVAPIKASAVEGSLTIPRLELCAALLLAQVLQRVYTVISPIVPISIMRAFTDSSIVLSWINADPKLFKIFVTNRIAKIRALIPDCVWSHVSSSENSADPASRGLLPSILLTSTLHWNGPSFLLLPEAQWPNSTVAPLSIDCLPETKTSRALVIQVNIAHSVELFQRFSSLIKLQRVISYCLRFIRRAQKRFSPTGPITRSELNYVLITTVKLTQNIYFSTLIKQIKGAQIICPASLAQLAPFIDPDGLLRVGGRLRFSSVSEDAKHPILLPSKAHITRLLIRHYHLSFLHGGPKLILAMISHKYWILSGRDAIRQYIFTCVPCTRYKANHPKPFMSDLPSMRVQPHRPFHHVGMDYGGPFIVKESHRRNARRSKVYLALFICMSVKAVHLELVSDLSTNAFLAALDRFVARRGIPAHLYSDCGTNYVGAARQLKTMFNDTTVQDEVISHLPCIWHFNPPAAPHFGGLWEAAIKSSKFHLKHVIGQQVLTFEELHTLVTRIEGILNSRPLTQASTDPHDLCALTPGHFLIGQALQALPEQDLITVPLNRLHRWQLIRQCHQSFWKRWSKEYLTTLQGRKKWFHKTQDITPGDMVIVEAPHRPPAEWRLGRITEVHPGTDDTVRVATIRTQDGLLKRPVVKLVRLPIEH